MELDLMTKRYDSLKEGGEESSCHAAVLVSCWSECLGYQRDYSCESDENYLSWAKFPFQKSLGCMSTTMMGGFRAGNTLHSDNPLWHSSRPKWPALPISPLSSRELTIPHPVASRDYLMALENLCLRHLLIPLRRFH